jgi:DNA-binding HxlR family transcriptional regulator
VSRDDAPGDLLALLELLGQRHALVLFWSLRGGARPFGTLAAGADANESVVSQRLRALRDGGLVEVDEAGDYRLTSTGWRLVGVLEPVAAFARDQWAALSPRQRRPRGAADKGRGEP